MPARRWRWRSRKLASTDRAAGVQRDLLAAAGKAGLPAVGQRLARNLALYEKRQPCRTPWADEEMP